MLIQISRKIFFCPLNLFQLTFVRFVLMVFSLTATWIDECAPALRDSVMPSCDKRQG